MKNLRELDKYGDGQYQGNCPENSGNFKVYVNGRSFRVVASVDDCGANGMWEHISVSLKNQKRCPTWEEMAVIKDLFFNPEEECVQFHPKHSEYVNLHNYCLHIWRPVRGMIGQPDISNVRGMIGQPDISNGGMTTLMERDAELEELWDMLSDVPMDPETEKLEAPFMHFPVGTDRGDIWRWFDKRHSKGVVYLLYRTEGGLWGEMNKMYQRLCMCPECDAETCIFNPEGKCMIPMITGEEPVLRPDGSCLSWRERDDLFG